MPKVEALRFSESSKSDFITRSEIADILGVSIGGVAKWEREGKIPHPIKIGGTLRWRRSVIDAWFANLEEQKSAHYG